jgi:hypothetical protein
MENVILRDVMPCGSCKNRRFGGTYRLHHQGDKNRRDNVVPSSSILVTLMTEAIVPLTSVLTRATRRNTPEDGILQLSYICTEI